MARYEQFLTDDKWERIKPHIPAPPDKGRGGRPRADDRETLEGILWVLKTGARWRDLPSRYPSPSTCWRRLREWEEGEVLLEIWRVFIAQLDARGCLEWEDTFADGSFAPAKKGAQPSGKPSGARARSGWWWSMARVFLWEVNLLVPPSTRRALSKLRLKRL